MIYHNIDKNAHYFILTRPLDYFPLLGMFIGRYIDKNELTPVEEKSLYYGTKALLDAMEDRL